MVSYDTTSCDSHLVFPEVDQKTLIYSWPPNVYLNRKPPETCGNMYSAIPTKIFQNKYFRSILNMIGILNRFGSAFR